MLTAFYDEEVVQLGDDTLRLAIDFRAIDLMEHIVGDTNAITPAPVIVHHVLYSNPCPLSISAKVLRSLLLRHHEELVIGERGMDICMGVISGEHSGRVGLAMQNLLRRAFNYGEPPKAKGKNPRKRRGASVTS